MSRESYPATSSTATTTHSPPPWIHNTQPAPSPPFLAGQIRAGISTPLSSLKTRSIKPDLHGSNFVLNVLLGVT